MRQVLVVVVFALVLFRSSLTRSQELPVAANAAPEVQRPAEDEALRVFEPTERMSTNTASQLVAGVIYGTIAIVLIMFLLIAYFHEPSHSRKPYSPTKVIRAEGFVPKRREREQKQERINLDDGDSD